jgi:predicted nucleic acid-binding protein
MIRALPITVIHPDDDIIREATRIRKSSIDAQRAGTGRKIATPDAIIMATANVTGRQVITRNPGDFSMAMRTVRIPYQIAGGVVTNVAPAP